MANVFTTLAGYAKLPAFWRVVKHDADREAVVFSLVRMDGRWALFYVTNRLVFRDAYGMLEDVRDLLVHPGVLRQRPIHWLLAGYRMFGSWSSSIRFRYR